ncbi:hypothetical protein ACHAXA_006860 [Cyclostephanos tholiformis]|uniref:Uncharacterized protein n=1 Tax=Cyclostephanos tholiformis TaxID=382380 RepID=A0ABD3RTU1_9STRA
MLIEDGNSHEEEKREEGDDDDDKDKAPPPPEMIAAWQIEGDAKSQIREGQKIASASADNEAEEDIDINSREDMGRLREINTDELHVTTSNLGFVMSSDQGHDTVTSVPGRIFPMNTTNQGGEDASSAPKSRDRVEMESLPTELPMSPGGDFPDVIHPRLSRSTFASMDQAPLPPEMVAASFGDDVLEKGDDFPNERIHPSYDNHGVVDDYAPDSQRQRIITDEENDDEEEGEGAPLPPDMVAASFEVDDAAKLEPIEDDVSGTPGNPGERADLLLEGQVNEEEFLWRKGSEDDDEAAPPRPEMIAEYFERDSHEEEKREEGEDEGEAPPRPPEVIAASYEEMEHVDGEARKKQIKFYAEDGTDPQVPVERIQSTPHTAGEYNIKSLTQDTGRSHESISNETPLTMDDRGVLPSHSSISTDRPRVDSANANVHDGEFSIAPLTRQGDDEPGLDVRNRYHAVTPSVASEGLMSPPRLYVDPNNQSLPLLQATLVQDVPDEPVYDAFPLGGASISDNDALPVWSMSIKCGKFAMIALISFGLVAVGAIVAGVVMRVRKDEPVVNTTIIDTVSANGIFANFLIDSPAWKRRGSPIVGDASYAEFGSSVALSSDASALAIGAPYHNDDTGYVKIYRVDDDGGGYSVQIGQTLIGNATDDYFGSSVDMTPDGTTVICGSPGYWSDDDRPGYVRVYSLEGDIDLGTDNWKQIGQDIVGEANGDNFGYSVSISEDGETIAIGAPNNDGSNGADSGRVSMYRLSDDGTTWVKIGQDIDGAAAYDWFGRSVSLSADGSTVAIGAPGHDGNGKEDSGRVNVYRFDEGGSSWEPLGQSIDGDNEYDWFGWSVSLTPDGNTLAIGAHGGNYVKVFSLSSGTWNQFGQGVVVGYSFGYSVSLSDDGRTLAVGDSWCRWKEWSEFGYRENLSNV